MAQRLKTVRIVVIEDNPADVLMVKKALREKGLKFQVSCFDNGDKALKALSRQDGKIPDLILLDLNLPTIEGIAVLIKIRNMPRLFGVPVVILTSSESSSDMRHTDRLGAARYIRKPLMLEDFLREVGDGVEEVLRQYVRHRA
jgi:CheY-like chemotaxis protein